MCFDGESLIEKGDRKEGVLMLKAVLGFDRGNDLYYPAIKIAEERLWALGELERPSLDKKIRNLEKKLPKMPPYQMKLAIAKAISKDPRRYPGGPLVALKMLDELNNEKPLDGKDKVVYLMLRKQHGHGMA